MSYECWALAVGLDDEAAELVEEGREGGVWWEGQVVGAKEREEVGKGVWPVEGGKWVAEC